MWLKMVIMGVEMEKIFYLVDVFTDRAFAGNPLAVFPDALGLSAETMQKIAAELNFSETAFVLPSDRGALRRLRIFTPRQELPLAGHPVVGTWTVLAKTGVVPAGASGSVVIQQELQAGILPVEIRFSDGEASFVMMRQAELVLGPPIADEPELVRLADALGLTRDDFAASPDLPVRTSNSGITSLDVPVVSLDALSRIKVDPNKLVDAYRSAGAIGCHVFAMETLEPASRVHARFFAPDDNISEDAATGSASGSLAGYLLHHGMVDAGEFIIEQGDFMGRPSRITCRVGCEAGNVTSIEVGGRAVVLASGTFNVPG